MSTTGTKVPAIIDIPADIDPKIKRVLDSLKEASEVRLGRRGDPRDRAITLRELVDSGLAVELKDNPFDPNAGTGEIDFALPPFVQPDPSAPVPPTPTGLSAGAAFTTITLNWNDPQISNLAFTEVWRNGSDNLGSATRVDTVSASVWSDTVDTAQTFFYWIRHVNTNSVTGTFSSSVSATTAQVNAARIENAIIDNTKLVDKTLTNAKIADETVTADILAGNSVIAGKIATNAIVANDGVIGNAAIKTAQIDDLAVTGAKIANLAVDTAQIASAAITNAKVGDLSADKITAGQINSDRIKIDNVTLDTDGSGNLIIGTFDAFSHVNTGSVGFIGGTSGQNESDNGQSISFSEIQRTSYGANGFPKHIAGESSTSASPSISQGDVVGDQGSAVPLFSFNFTTAGYSGNRDFLIMTGLDFTGSSASSSECVFAVAMRATTSATNFRSTTNSDYVFTEKITSVGTHSLGVHNVNAKVSLPGNTEHYIWCFGIGDDGVSSYKSGFINVLGLNK